MSDKEKTNLIFLPGLSTAEKVTDLSGRGVGMDVVRTNIEKLGGNITLDSNWGRLLRIATLTADARHYPVTDYCRGRSASGLAAGQSGGINFHQVS